MTEVMALWKRAAEIKAQLDAVKPLYDELDKITVELAALMVAGREFDLPDGSVGRVVNNFAEANTVFRPAGVKRFELKIMTAEEIAYSKMSKSEKTAYNKAKNLKGE